ncbi:MAG TPA: MarR family winged helix-turn-helix transcriptional regulator [Lapillicoccus sp.]
MPASRRHLTADVWGSLLRTQARVVPLIDAQLRATGVSLAFYDVLLELQAAPGGRLTMSDLGMRVVLSRSRVSRVVDDMVAVGLVRRETNPEDARSAYAVITSSGRNAFRRTAPTYLDLIEQHVACDLTTQELVVLSRLLERIATAPDGERK